MDIDSRPARDDLEDFYCAHYARLVAVVALAAGSRATAEDVVQEAFVRLIGEWQSVARYDSPEAWVRRVAFRLLSNKQRKARNGIRALSRDRRTPVPGPTGDAVDVQVALRALPLGQRQVIVLHYLVGLPTKEVAAELKISQGTVKSRLSRARVALVPLLKEEVENA